MFEATLQECSIFKRIVESIKDLVNDVNIETNATGTLIYADFVKEWIGISLQAMDSSHVALVSLNLQAEGFQSYRSDKPLTLGTFKL